MAFVLYTIIIRKSSFPYPITISTPDCNREILCCSSTLVAIKGSVISLKTRSSCTSSNAPVVEDTLRLGIKNKPVYFVLLSACCIFVT